MTIFYNILLSLDLIIAVLFVIVVMIQSSKSEGFTMGASAASATPRAKPGFEDQMSRVTLYMGATFMTLTALLAIIQSRM
ncbi:MAG: preprotein translocase subunit SecG [bacterium]|jgi:protein translocase SecG subunit